MVLVMRDEERPKKERWWRISPVLLNMFSQPIICTSNSSACYEYNNYSNTVMEPIAKHGNKTK